MKRIISNILVFFLQTLSYAQGVEDFAGKSTQAGWIDSSIKLEAKFNNPHGLDIGPDGTMYIADRYNHRIRKIDTNGVVTTVAGNGTVGDAVGIGLLAQFNEPWDVCVGNNGEVYIADSKNNKIKVLYPNGIVSLYAGTGNVGFSDNSRLASSFYWPSGVEYDHKTNTLYIADHLSHLIRKITPSGQVSTLAGSKDNFPNNHGSDDGVGALAKFYRPYGIHLSNDGFLYVADEWNSMIRRVSLNGAVTTIAGKSEVVGYKNGSKDSSLYNYPWDIATDINNNIYVLDGFNHVIRKIDPISLESSLFAGTPKVTGAKNAALLNATFNGATGIQYYNGSLYIADAFNHVIRRIQLTEIIKIKDVSNKMTCFGDTVTLVANPKYYDRYYWYQGDKFLKVTNEPNLRYKLTSSDKISVQGERDGVGLSVSDTINFIRNVSQITIQKTPLNTFCKGDSVRLESGIDNSIWNIGKTSKSIIVKQDGTYSFEVYDQGCLTQKGSIDVKFDANPVISISPQNGFLGRVDSVVFVVSGAQSYLWSDGSKKDSLVSKVLGDYSVKGFSSAFCPSESKKVSVTPDPFIKAKADSIELDFKQIVGLDVLVNDDKYANVHLSILNPSSIPITVRVENSRLILENKTINRDTIITFTYKICYVNSSSICSETMVLLKLKASPYSNLDDLFFPEGFSPNGDNKNDNFEVLGLENSPENNLQVFNRWGQLVYQVENYVGDWGGINNSGKNLLEGTYFYIFIDKLTSKKYHGYVELQR